LESDMQLKHQVVALQTMPGTLGEPPGHRSFAAKHAVARYLPIAASILLGVILAGAAAYLALVSKHITLLQAKLDELSKTPALAAGGFDPTFSLIAGVQRSIQARPPVSIAATAK